MSGAPYWSISSVHSRPEPCSSHHSVATTEVTSHIGEEAFINYDCVFLDCNRITIGREVQIAPRVQIYTATHPLDAATRRSKLEFALPVVIKDGAWLGGGVIVCPGVTIGENTVVGAGSVVTRDLPPGVLAVGNPCRVLRSLDK